MSDPTVSPTAKLIFQLLPRLPLLSGERLMDRIEYEEWSLKTLERGSVPPALLDLPEVESKMGDNQLKSQTGKSDQVVSDRRRLRHQQSQFLAHAFPSPLASLVLPA